MHAFLPLSSELSCVFDFQCTQWSMSSGTDNDSRTTGMPLMGKHILLRACSRGSSKTRLFPYMAWISSQTHRGSEKVKVSASWSYHGKMSLDTSHFPMLVVCGILLCNLQHRFFIDSSSLNRKSGLIPSDILVFSYICIYSRRHDSYWDFTTDLSCTWFHTHEQHCVFRHVFFFYHFRVWILKLYAMGL